MQSLDTRLHRVRRQLLPNITQAQVEQYLRDNPKQFADAVNNNIDIVAGEIDEKALKKVLVKVDKKELAKVIQEKNVLDDDVLEKVLTNPDFLQKLIGTMNEKQLWQTVIKEIEADIKQIGDAIVKGINEMWVMSSSLL